MVRKNDGSSVTCQPETGVEVQGEMYCPIKVHVSDAQPSI